ATLPYTYFEHKSKIDATNQSDQVTQFDPLGRVNRTAKVNGEPGPNVFDQTDTCFDPLGRKSFVRYPYAGSGWGSANTYSCANSASSPGDTFAYDALSRPTSVTNSDGSLVTTSYSG